MKKEEIIEKILELKKQKDVLILGHFYQIPEIQDISDFVGDSLNLAQKAMEAQNKIILFCGVHFMGETAKILNPSKKVLIPDMNASCSLADLCDYEEFKAFKAQYPDHIVISYVNCSAKIKTLSDIICTSGNALQIVNSLPENQKIIFAPDRNLGGYINHVTGRNMVLYHAYCEVHELLTAQRTLEMKAQNPDALLIAHPECNKAVLQVSDFVGSTSAMINFVKKSQNKKFLVATESGILHKLQNDNPEKTFIVVSPSENCECNNCRHMKLNTLEKVLNTLETESNEIILDQETILMARKPIDKMLELSKKLNLI